MTNYLKVNCGLKPGSQAHDEALNHVYQRNYITGAAPYVFQPTGVIDIGGQPCLNTYLNRHVLPADELTPWGPEGKHPFLSYWLDAIFDPAEQLPYFLAWHKHFYESAYLGKPMPGQNIFLMGGVGVGKTLMAWRYVGASVGGFADASSFLVRGSTF